MNLTKDSKSMLSFFMKNNCLNHVKLTQKTKDILKKIYVDIIAAYNFLNALKKNKRGKIYNINIKKITTASQIIQPKNFNYNSFPEEVRKHIDQHSMTEITYTFSLFNRNIKLIFIIEEGNIEHKIGIYNKYVDSMIIWLHILNEYASNQCSANFVVYLYFTSLEKSLPKSNINVLDRIHINTAFTTTCPIDSEIVIFRKEEWFNSFLHETFHNFALDFSDMNNINCHNHILSIFKVNSEVNIFESYTEFWAEIINSLFCSFFMLKDKYDYSSFMKNAEFLINYERTYSFFQLVKTLDFMNLTYTDLYSNTTESSIKRNTLYKERTNVLAYYVIKTIMINNYQSFLLWCNTNNYSLLQFKKTYTNQREFCKFIEKNYKSKSMLECIQATEDFLDKFYKTKRKSQHIDYLLSNMRMTICEMG